MPPKPVGYPEGSTLQIGIRILSANPIWQNREAVVIFRRCSQTKTRDTARVHPARRAAAPFPAPAHTHSCQRSLTSSVSRLFTSCLCPPCLLSVLFANSLHPRLARLLHAQHRAPWPVLRLRRALRLLRHERSPCLRGGSVRVLVSAIYLLRCF